MMEISPTAINATYQNKVATAYIWIRKYHDAVNQDADAKAERCYNRYMPIIEALPKREIANLQKFHVEHHGYEF